ncbi:MAG: DMT family transporter [Burkholderiaceae bacterium]|nr:DMT family transporter [Burkholderiaceae bacterium]
MLVLLTLCWGVNWPIMKFGVTTFPPMSFRALGMIGSLPVLWMAARLQGESIALPRAQIGVLIRLAIPNILVWNILLILGVKLLSSGRAAVLSYTMPIWAVLSALLFFKEKPGKLAWVGIFCATAGALLLLSGEMVALTGRPLGTLLALGGAASWGFGTVQMKHTHVPMPTTAMTFWMFAFSALAMFPIAIACEATAWQMPDTLVWLSILYNAVLVFGLANIFWFRLARALPPAVSSLSVMMIPVVGVFSGAWLLSENPHWQDYVAMLLILISMGTVLRKKTPRD